MLTDSLRKTLIDAASYLDHEGVSYALIGGFAVSLRGQARVTADVDMVISADVERALSLVETLQGTNFRPLFDGVAEVVQRSFILPLRHRDTNIKVDLALGLSGFEQQTVARAERLTVGGSSINVATAEDLLVMKILAGRPQDEQDVQGLVIAQGERLDWNYCLDLAAGLESALDVDLVERIQALRTDK